MTSQPLLIIAKGDFFFALDGKKVVWKKIQDSKYIQLLIYE